MSEITAIAVASNRSRHSWSPEKYSFSSKARFGASPVPVEKMPPTVVVHLPEAGTMASARCDTDEEDTVTYRSTEDKQHHVDDNLDKYDINYNEYLNRQLCDKEIISKHDYDNTMNSEHNYDARELNQHHQFAKDAEIDMNQGHDDVVGEEYVSHTPPSSRNSVRESYQQQQKLRKEPESGHLGLEASLMVSRLDLRPHDLLELTKDLYSSRKQKNNNNSLGILLRANHRLPPISVKKDLAGPVEDGNIQHYDEIANRAAPVNLNLPENSNSELPNSTIRPNVTYGNELASPNLPGKFDNAPRVGPQFSLLHPLVANSKNKKRLEARHSSTLQPLQLDRVTLRKKAICALRDGRLQPIITEYLKHHADRTAPLSNPIQQTTARDARRPKQARRQKRFKFSDVKIKSDPYSDNLQSNTLSLAAIKLRLCDS